ncbi:hypothetical protein [Deinococcus peraridilitoris]|uniref:Uncharacterized protein n=1 Tax=Deinococcus peraridilitoris (strain DSM 19664 / LMG 22246 / CIP 109416 / KR-200) TaxID=937777 RepID=L0A1H8_DEIPD|nr:hypothetical protein [Deinococcus peraridilitoris]AFZ67032.1 hypothetical protein Deipe_1491 [Deinococcus peraridilitoris DSM 19664]
MNLTETTIEHTTAKVKQARVRLHAAIDNEADKRLTLEYHEAEKLLEGVPGKNESERQARLLVDLHEDHEALEEAEQETRAARLDFDLAVADLDALKLALRLRESSVKEGTA